MGIQEIIAFAVVLIAGVFTARIFIRQFTRGDAGEKCSKCELSKAVAEKKA